jgi:hypothetical protein
MRAILAGLILLALALPFPASARTSVNIGVSIGNAPPPPFLAFQYRPRFAYVPDYRVYVIDDGRYGDYDCYQFGDYYYLHNGDWWYRARGYRGPFVAVSLRTVPRVVYNARSHGVHGRGYNWSREHAPGNRGHGNGHGNGDRGRREN